MSGGVPDVRSAGRADDVSVAITHPQSEPAIYALTAGELGGKKPGPPGVSDGDGNPIRRTHHETHEDLGRAWRSVVRKPGRECGPGAGGGELGVDRGGDGDAQPRRRR